MYLFSYASITQLVPPGSDIQFDSDGATSGVTHLVPPAFLITTTGTYRISYDVNVATGTGSDIALTVNNVVDPSTVVPVQSQPTEVSGDVILSLSAGDIVTVRNDSGAALTTVGSPGVGASIDIVSVG